MGITLFWIPSLAPQFTHVFLQRVFIECLLYARGPAVLRPSQAWLCHLQRVLKLEKPQSPNFRGQSGMQFWREVWGLGAHWWQDGGKVVKALVTCSPEGPYAYVPPPPHPLLSSALAFLRNASPHPPALHQHPLTAPFFPPLA